MPVLKWIQPKGQPRVYPVFKKVTTVGRAHSSDITIDSKNLEDLHMQLVFDGRDFNAVEADSGADMRVNGKRKRKTKVFHNDEIQMGDVECVFSLFDETVTPNTPSNGHAPSELLGMKRLVGFSQRLNELRTVNNQLEALLDTVVEVTHAQKGFILLMNEGKTTVTAARNLKQEDVPEEVWDLSDSVISRVIENQKALIVSDALNDTMFKSSESVMNLKLSSVMCAPLMAQGQMLGLIYVGNNNVVSLFDESSLDILTVFAAQGALILQSAILRDELITDRNDLATRLEDKKFGDIIGTCPSLLEVFRKVEKVAATDISVLITGETGTGKELIAREIHRRSPRQGAPFVVVNCGAIPENLMESELFGHVKGAFTGAVAARDGKFQAAHQGTLFLDEIGEMPMSLQVKLLRALQERVVTRVGENRPESVDIRVIAATNRDLDSEIKEGNFREDLFYRLNVVNLHLPPLRERGEDVVVIAKFLLQKYATEFASKVKGFTPNALVSMQKYEWPGNVRQLDNRIKKALVLCDRTLVGPEDLDLFAEAIGSVVPLSEARESFQRRYVLEVLERNNGNRTKTARDLDVDPRTIFRYLERSSKTP